MSTDIHRLLDEAFAGVEMTPDAQDLKEEIRANLVARVDELEFSGRSSSDAAREAIAELGDVRDLLDGTGDPSDSSRVADSTPRSSCATACVPRSDSSCVWLCGRWPSSWG